MQRKSDILLLQEPYVGSTGELSLRHGFRIVQKSSQRTKDVKAVVVIVDDELVVQVDQKCVTENMVVVNVARPGGQKLTLVSVYFEGTEPLEPYLETLGEAIASADNLIVGGDVNAKSVWWGGKEDDDRGQLLLEFLSSWGLHISNVGNVPTFEVYRGGRYYSSIVDVTLVTEALMDKVSDWRVDRTVVQLSDHNCITFQLETAASEGPRPTSATRKYDTRKAHWSQFQQAFREKLEVLAIPAEHVASFSKAQLEAYTEKLMESLEDACDQTLPRVKPRKKRANPWWTRELTEKKKEVIRRRRRIRGANPHRRPLVVQHYLEALDEYKSAIQEARITSWKRFCSEMTRGNVWDGAWKVIRRNAGPGVTGVGLKDARGDTLSPAESARLIADTLFPDDSPGDDTPEQAELRRVVNAPPLTEHLGPSGPPITGSELLDVLSTMNPKKAPGEDGLTADICEAAIRTDCPVFLAVFNRCLEIGLFPRRWKSARVCVIPKPGKGDYTSPKAYRPIGLLPVMGKVLEKLFNNRLLWHLEARGHLNTRQYGFMPQRGTEDALYDLVNLIKHEAHTMRRLVAVVSLDIEGAFDHAWWPFIKAQLVAKNCPADIFGLVDSYLRDRSITIDYAGAMVNKNTTRGCVQGSISGPLMWNVVLDSLLELLEGSPVHVQAFADDVVLVASADTAGELESMINPVLDAVAEWGTEHKLRFSPHKTALMMVTRKMNPPVPCITMATVPLTPVDKVRVLGLIIDKNLTFRDHVQGVCAKAAAVYKGLARAAKASWGLGPEIVRTLYIGAIEPILLYAASSWADSTSRDYIVKHLRSTQRLFAIKIAKAYRTVSFDSAVTIARLLPIELRAREAAELYTVKRGKPLMEARDRRMEMRTPFFRLPHPGLRQEVRYTVLDRLEDLAPEDRPSASVSIYTDGSKIEGKVGCAFTCWRDGREVLNKKFRLEPFCTVYQSELFALRQAVRLTVENPRYRECDILSDSRSSLDAIANPRSTNPLVNEVRLSLSEAAERGSSVKLWWVRAHIGTAGNERADELAKHAALHKKTAADYDRFPLSYARREIRQRTLDAWQAEYSTSEKGSITKLFFPDIRQAFRVIGKIGVSYWNTQAWTGHGGNASYLHRFRRCDDPRCQCSPDAAQTIRHVLNDCPVFGAKRLQLELEFDQKVETTTWSSLLAGKCSGPKFAGFCAAVMKAVAQANKAKARPP